MISPTSYRHILGDGPRLGNAASVVVAVHIRQTGHAGMVSVPGERTHLAVLVPPSLAGGLGPSWETGYKQRGKVGRQLSPLLSRLALTAIAPFAFSLDAWTRCRLGPALSWQPVCSSGSLMPRIRLLSSGRRREHRDLAFNATVIPFHRHGQDGDKDQDLDANDASPGHGSDSSGHSDSSSNQSKGGDSDANDDGGKNDDGNGSGSSGGDDDKGGDSGTSSSNNNNGQIPGHGDPFPGFCGAAPNPIPLDPSQCVLVNENDGRLKYGPGWTLATSDPFGEHRTSHSTSMNGSSVVVDFNGTSIIVFGTVPQSNATFAPPSASYSVDGHKAIELSLPIASMCIPNQQLFRSPELPPGAHNLTINVFTPNGTSYTLDYLYFCTTQPTRSSNSTGAETKAVVKDKFSRLDGIILGSVLGGVVFLLCLAALVWYLVQQRKRMRRLRQLHIAASPVSSWLHWNSRSGGSAAGTEVAFTSTESILRGNPSSSTKRSEIISMPIPTTPLPDEPGSPPGLARYPSRREPYAATPRRERTSLAPPPWAYSRH